MTGSTPSLSPHLPDSLSYYSPYHLSAPDAVASLTFQMGFLLGPYHLVFWLPGIFFPRHVYN
jgi:hypothetical protein